MTDFDPNMQNDFVTFEVRVIPRSSKSEIVGVIAGTLKVKLKCAPVDGAANEELVQVLAKAFGRRRAQVEILSGHSSKNKRVRISNISEIQIKAVLKAKS